MTTTVQQLGHFYIIVRAAAPHNHGSMPSKNNTVPMPLQDFIIANNLEMKVAQILFVKNSSRYGFCANLVGKT